MSKESQAPRQASWREKPLLLSASKKSLLHTHGENLIREAAEQFRRDLSATLYQPDTMLAPSVASRPHLVQKVGWQPCRGAVLSLEVTEYDSDARGNRSVVVDRPLTIDRTCSP